MATFVKLSVAAAGLGNPIYGNSGVYTQASDGTISADSRDVAALLAAGATYIAARTASYGPTIAAATGTVGQLVASTSLANGALTIANQPDVMRQGRLIITAGTAAVTGGTISIPYVGNDGVLTTDVLSVAAPASGTATLFTSKGIAVLNTPTVAGLVGGASPAVQLDTTNALSVPVDAGTKDIVFLKEFTNSGNEAIGTVSTTTLATVTPTTAPNATHTFGWMYTYNVPDV